MAEYTLGKLKLHCQQGNIVEQPAVDAIVNAANAQLQTGGGVAGAIHRAAGPGLAEECRPQAPIQPGQAVITSAHDLPNQWVIHCLGPVYGVDKPSDQLLADCYRNALELADEKQLTSVAFPALSTGAFGYPMADAAEVAGKTIAATADSLQSVQDVYFILFSDKDRQLHDEVFQQLFKQ